MESQKIKQDTSGSIGKNIREIRLAKGMKQQSLSGWYSSQELLSPEKPL